MTKETWQKILDILEQEEKLCDEKVKKDKIKLPEFPTLPFEDFPEYPDLPTMPNNYGWICPRCGRGNSPNSNRCGCLDYPVLPPWGQTWC